MRIRIDPKVDYAFKHVFGRDESKSTLISLLDAVLQPPAGQRIAELDLLNPFNDRETPSDRLSILDIKARDQSGRQFNVEMQMLAYGAFRPRALYYWARLHQGQLKRGKDFRLLRPTIAVCFVDTSLFPELVDYHLTFELRERRHRTLFTDQMAVHILELTKFNKAVEQLATPLDRWLFFLRHAPTLDADALPESLNVPEVRRALGDLKMISRSKRARERYEAREKMQRDVYTALAEKLDEGIEKGIERGLERGLQQGRSEGRAEGRAEHIQYLQRLLRQNVLSLEKLRSLPAAELTTLATRLETQLKARLANGP